MRDEAVAPRFIDEQGNPQDHLTKSYTYDYVRGLASTMGYPDVCSALQDLTRLKNQHREITKVLTEFVTEVKLQSYPLEHLGALVIDAEKLLNEHRKC